MSAKSSSPQAAPAELPGEHLSYLRLLLIVIGSIFLAEVVAMIFIHRLPLPYYSVTLIDAGVMAVLLFPVLYFLSFRPLILHIDKRRQAEMAAKAERQRFNDILETLPGYLVLLTPDYHVPFANHFFRERFGEARGRRCYEYLFGRDTPCEICDTYKVLKTMQPGRWEWTGPDHHIYDVYDFPFTDTDGSTLILEMGIDITDQKQAEAQVHQLSRIVEQTEDTVVVTKRDGVIEYVNPSFERLTGYTKEEALGKTPRVIKSDHHDQAFYQNLWNTILAGEVFQSEMANRKKNGEIYYEVKTITPLRDMQGNITHFVATGKDITEHKLDEEKLRKAYDELELRVQERTEELRIANFDLEQEIVERKRAEETLRKANQRLQDQAEELDAQAEELRLQTEELKDINERLIESEATLQSILNATQESIWLFSTDGVIRAANTIALARMNMPAKDILGKHFSKLMPAKTAQLRQTYLTQVINTGQPVEFEDQRLDIIFHHNFYPVMDASGCVTGVVAFSRDITERKRAEEALRLSEEKFALAFANNPAAIALTRLDDGLFLEVNDTWVALTGYSREEAIGHSARKLPIWPSAEAAARFVQELREKGSLRGWEQEFLKKSGEVYVAQLSAQLLIVQNETLILSTLIDITERKRAEEALQRSEARFRGFYESGLLGVIFWNVDGTISDANDKFLEIVGYDRDDLAAGRIDWLNMTPPEYRHLDEASIKELQAGGINKTPFEKEYIRKDGARVPVLVAGAMLDETLSNGVAFVLDITERKRAQEREQQLTRTLKALNRSNQAMLRSRSETELLNEVCKIIIEDCGHAMVWIGFKEEAEKKSVRPVASAGFEEGYLENMRITWADTERGRGPTGTAVRTGETRRCRNMLTDPQFAPWREQALKRGYASSIALPLKAQENVLGAVTIYSRQADSFADEEEQLLRELAGDLAYGITSLRLQAARAQAEEALRVSEERYRTLFNSMTEGFALHEIICDEAGQPCDYRFLEINPSFERLTGLKRDKVVGRTVCEALPGTEAYWIQTYGRVALTGQPAHFDNYSAALDRHYEVYAYSPAPGQFAVLFVDITERKRAEDALRESENKFSILFGKASMPAVLSRFPDHVFVDVNDAWAEAFGYTKDDLIGKTSIELGINRDMERRTNLINTIQQHTPVRNLEQTLYTKSGEARIVLTNVNPITIGGQDYALASFQDITERKRAEETLQNLNAELELRVQERTKKLNALNKKLRNEIKEREEIERQLRIRTTAMEAAANGILITDPRGNIQWANPALAQITGYDSQDLIGQSTHIFSSGQNDKGYYRQLWDTILAGQVWRGEITNRRRDGSLYVEEQTITPVRDAKHQIQHFIAVKQDITERKQAEEELERRNVELQIISTAEHKQRQFSEALVQAALVLNRSLDLDEVLALILRQIKEVIPYRLADIALLEGETFYDACHQGDLEWPALNNQFLLKGFPLINKVRQSREPILVPNTQKEPEWVVIEGMETVRSFLSAPLLAEEKVIGFVNLFGDQPGFFTQEMSNRLVAFAAHATAAIQNAWLFEQVRASSERLQSLSHRLVEIQENERLYIARELHDEAGQMLTSLMLDLVTLESQADQPEVILKKVPEMEEMLNAVSENLHNVAMALRPASLDHLGLVPALRQYAESVGERSRLKVSFRAGNIQERLPANVETELYRIVQEALTNVVRHAHASQVDVVLTVRDHKLIVIIEDDGNGFDPEKVPDSGHLGLFGMRERAEMIGGQLVIESKPGKGTTIMVEVDYDSPIVDRG